MLFFVFIILAGYLSVKCDDASNYYVIEMPTDVTTVRSQKPFNVYWNVPTMQCKSKKLPFTNLYEKYGIIQNSNDSFRGEKVTILYDPGLFPALLKNESSGKFKFRNGGVPQEGNITSHLDAFRSTVEKSIPDEKFDGIGIIDFESWRPVFRQNFGVLVPYKDVSVQIEKKLHWWWPNTWLQEEAKDRFEEAARQFMQNTVSVAKQLRPRARWGYYGFPYCFNVATNNPGEACPNNVIRENNQIKWLWSESTALYPSIYSSVNLTSKQLTWLVRGRVSEAARVRGGGGAPILPYFWFRYRDAGFMTQQDLDIVLKTLYKSEASGFIIWGSSNDVNTVNKCNKLQEYVNKILGPAIAKYVKYSIRLDDETTVIPETITERETILTTNNINDTTDLLNPTNITNQDTNTNKTINMKLENVEIQIDPFKFSQDTYERNILQEVEDELNKKSAYISDTDDIKDIDKKDDQGLIEIFMNLINSKSNNDLKTNNTKNYSVPFLDYISIILMTNNTNVNASKDLNNENQVSIINEVTTEIPSTTYKDNDYNEVNTILNELNNLVAKKETFNNEFYINTEQTTREIQTELNTEETLSTRTYITSEVISTTESQIYSSTEINEVNLFDTKYIETTTDNENIEINTETEKSLTTEITEKLDEYTEIIYSTTMLPTSNNLEVTDVYTTNSNEYENLLEKSTNESLDSYDEVTEISILDDLEDKISKNTNEELEYNYTAYSLPSSITDKVPQSNVACRQKDIIYAYIFLLYIKVFI
ncbi:PREDICTED: hyaluronidase PH-20-like isoform X1 [Papilio xuthus]|uniref:Hyaluronidase n=1 Tax=Papilio xuthus TaxID=66420 RepID=A0AAJ6ZBA9_PAPXU|nr:PREDICTED: hyaluronidase PH-20-like isoform X1 [Papilio xuthus]